jgi:hypothetical protein
MELDPFARPWAMALALIGAHQYDAAMQDASLRSQAHPGDAGLHWILSVAYSAKGMEKESVQEWEKNLELEGHADLAADLRRAFAQGGYHGALEWNLSVTKKRASHEYVERFELAQDYAMLRRTDETLRYLELSYKERDPSMAELQSMPEFNFLHSDSRYRAIVEKMRLPQAD